MGPLVASCICLLHIGSTFEALFLRDHVEAWLQKFHELDSGGAGRIPINACIAMAGRWTGCQAALS